VLELATPRCDQHRICPALEHVGLVRVSPARAHRDECLTIDGTHARDELPVQLASAHAEIGRIGEHVDALLTSQEKGILGEADVVADPEAESRIFCLKS